MLEIPNAPDGFGRIVVSCPGAPMFTFLAPLNSPLGLVALQSMVGGNIEFLINPVDVMNGTEFDEFSVFGYEEARIFGHKRNETMTHWQQATYGYDLLGTMLILGANEGGQSVALDQDKMVELQATLPQIQYHDFDLTAWPTLASAIHGR